MLIKIRVSTLALMVTYLFQLNLQPTFAQSLWKFSFSYENPILSDIEPFQFQEGNLTRILSEIEANTKKDWIYSERFLKAYPQILKIILIRENLISILESYKHHLPYMGESDENRNLVDSKIQFLKDILIKPSYEFIQKPKINPYNVFYEFSSTRFLVDGIPTPRLAVNDGNSIIFNGDALSSKTIMTEEIVQIWLHELFHFDENTPLKVKDQWNAKLIEWLRGQTQRITNDRKETLSFISLPKSNPEIIRPYYESNSLDYFTGTENSFEKVLKNHLKSQLLLIPENFEKTKLVDSVFSNLLTNFNQLVDQFSDCLGLLDDWRQIRIAVEYDKAIGIKWPNLEIIDIKNKPDGSFSFTFNMNIQIYEQKKNGLRSYRYERISTPPNPNYPPYHNFAVLPKYRFTVDINPSNEMITLKRDYTTHLEDSQFEVNSIQDTKHKRYMSLSLKFAQAEDKFKYIEEVKILAKDSDTNQRFSFTPISYKIKSPMEIIIHVEVPKSKLEIKKILIPKVSQSGLYSEIIFLPAKPQSIIGAQTIFPTEFKIFSFNLSPKKNLQKIVERKIMGNIHLLTNKSVVGITLELDHTIKLYNVRWEDHRNHSKELLGKFYVGRKYFLNKRDIEIDSDSESQILRFQIPEKGMSQFKSGPEYTKQIGWAYKTIRSNQAATMEDGGLRNFTNVLIHFKDGTTESIPPQFFPKTFSFIYFNEDYEKLQREVEKLKKPLVVSESDETNAFKQCQKIFK